MYYALDGPQEQHDRSGADLRQELPNSKNATGYGSEHEKHEFRPYGTHR